MEAIQPTHGLGDPGKGCYTGAIPRRILMTNPQALPFSDAEQQQFERSALVCLLWCEKDLDTSEPLDTHHDVSDLHASALASLRDDFKQFLQDNANDLIEAKDTYGYTLDQAGHDFILSRNGHGAGFFDRGLEEIGDRLQKAAGDVGSTDAYVGDDGYIYLSGREEPQVPTPEQPPSSKPRGPRP